MIVKLWRWFRYRTDLGDATFGRYSDWKFMRSKKKEVDEAMIQINARIRELKELEK